MDAQVEVQYAVEAPHLPDAAQIRVWVARALQTAGAADSRHEVVVRIVAAGESADLNARYRRKSGPTNVLSFPFEAPAPVPSDLLGDLVLCAPVIEDEARQQAKAPVAHWAHMVVHGVLHLLGYDHQSEPEAARMEDLETRALAGLGYGPPYEDNGRSTAANKMEKERCHFS